MLRVAFSFGMVLLTAGHLADSPVLPGQDITAPQPKVKLYRVNFEDVPFVKAMEELERITGLLYLGEDVPNLRITLRNREPIRLEEVFDQLNSLLEPHDYVVDWRKQSFGVTSQVEKRSHGGGYRDMVSLDDLRGRPKKWKYKMFLNVSPDGGLEAAERAAGRFDRTFELQSFGANRILVRGRVMDLRQFVDEMGDHIKR